MTTRRGTRVYPLPDRARLEVKVALFKGLLENRRGLERIPEAPAALYKDLLGEALAGLPANIDRLILVRDKPLHLMPFAVLTDSPGGRTLAETFNLSTVPSVTFWLKRRMALAVPFSQPVLALADPAHAYLSPGAEPARGRMLMADRNTRLGPLPHARLEGKAVLRRLGAKGRLLVAEKASETALKSEASHPYAVLHLAAHALVNTAGHKANAAILLAPGPGAEDGFLWTDEIAELDLEGKLVVLSACRTGSGTVLRGEGPMSLARAFFQAGAHTVVASLWNLRDDDAALLFDNFYKNLASGGSVAQSLRDAQLTRIQQGAPSAAWAGLVVYGKGDLVPFSGGLPRRIGPFHILVIACLLALVALGLRRRYRLRQFHRLA